MFTILQEYRTHNNHAGTSVLGNYFVVLGENILVPICADIKNVQIQS